MNRRSFNLRLLTSCLLILAPAKLFASTHPWFDKSKQYSGLFPYYHVDKWTLHKPLYLVTDKKIFIEIFSLCVRNSRQTIPAEFHEHIEYFHLPSVESRDDPKEELAAREAAAEQHEGGHRADQQGQDDSPREDQGRIRHVLQEGRHRFRSQDDRIVAQGGMRNEEGLEASGVRQDLLPGAFQARYEEDDQGNDEQGGKR